MSTTNNDHHHHHHSHSGKKDETGAFRRRMSDHVKRIRLIRRIVWIVALILAALVTLAVIYAYIIDR